MLHAGFEPGKLFKHDEGWPYFLNQLQSYCKKWEVHDAIRFVSNKFNEKQKTSDSPNEDDEESNEPDYDEDKDQLEEEQEEEAGEIMTTSSSTTTNQIFWTNLHLFLPFKHRYTQKNKVDLAKVRYNK